MHGAGNVELAAVAGSRDEPYTVEVVPEGEKVSLFCNCPAGNMTRLCKHKLGVAAGDQGVLDNPESQQAAWGEAQQLIAASSLRAAVDELQAAIGNAAVSKDKIKSMKMAIARKMAYGG